ncbi:MAG TPA: MBL fold metallo-hydrolase [Candidatus Angelobacter sp.]
MKFRVLVCLVAVASLASAQQRPQESPAALLRDAFAAMGGEDKVRQLKTLHWETVGHRNLLEQSERPEGPYIVEYEQTEEWRDLEHGRWRQESRSRNVLEENAFTVIVTGGAAAQKFGEKEMPGSGEQLQLANDALAFGPEKVLLNALAAADLKRLPDLVLQGVPHQLIQFTHAGTPVRVYLNADTHLPTAVEWVMTYPYGIFWSVWGDVTTRVYYSLWWLQDGIHYPRQMDTFRNGMPDRSEAITKIEFNSPIQSDLFVISPETRNAFSVLAKMTVDDRPLGSPSRPAQEPAPGIVVIPAAFYTTLVRQADGIVILEAPLSSGYSAKVLAEAERRFPGTVVKAVITTSDAWPHIGGIREYAARGIPIYLLDRNVPLIERLLGAPKTGRPDALAKAPRKPIFREVSGRTTIGTGPNRFEVVPMRGETTERQMLVYFPEQKLLYGSDAFSKLLDGTYFIPQTVSEVAAAVEREHLTVEKFFMMHMPLTPWQDALNELQKAR